jgi:hypothetical protein
MNTPTGLVTANITARYTMICSQPFTVIFGTSKSEPRD